MNQFRIKILVSAAILLLFSCKKVLDIEPTDKIRGEVLFSDPEGTKLYMANLYYQLPTEDLSYHLQGFNANGPGPIGTGGLQPAMVTDEAIHSEWGVSVADDQQHYWEQGYKLIRDVNILIDAIPTLQISDQEKDALIGESAFIRAFAYFALVKRYGGVPLITSKQEYSGSIEALKVPRSTEKDSWDFVLAECDRAIEKLGTDKGRRANKYMAYSLKARAALFAASVAKFGSRAPLSGAAVTQKLVGLDASLAKGYYQACIAACEGVMNSGQYSLYKPNPASPEEAAENYRQMFEDPNRAPEEAIMIKGYAMPGDFMGHNYDIWYQPAQTANGWPHPGRMNPILEMIDKYESYTNPGHDAPIITTADGDYNDYNGYNPSENYLRFNNTTDIFKDKDARLWATIVLPGTMWKNTKIIIQAGFVKPDGQAVIRTNANITVNGNTYYTYGAASVSQYSGFDPYGGNNTRTGFSFKKFLNQNKQVIAAWNQSTTDFMEFRYAEILLTYAEAVFESGEGDAQAAKTALNATRRRAGHTVDIPLTAENIERERAVELAYENKRFWDLIRRREYHTLYNNTMIHGLFPLLDLRALPQQKYIFVRAVPPNEWYKTFQPRGYYKAIPGIGANGLVQNPQY
ncbi:RagB/SusD family nutrient uptake outer membrane protein [Mucilaginibacter limnophilus]|uniref:RagB/SusD family nutrient uptake outer membrane protein n=1 Tax=Mucilaginibacter limnophilus TaxID=1932778 RepID=A0A3S2UPL4_9SPHI|nr:RagB/SusD family nutrient uptake outer membrane protein [Mucilaginibacter limnophilus]RVU02904.1 RagB/SusD family nutrient uptake outer membrane protein [Mucilaginibacter limnophilus]